MVAIYADIEVGDWDGTVYGYQSVYEDPYYAQFCYHYNNVFATNLYSPSGQVYYGEESVSGPYEDIEGDWFLDVAYAADCPCAGTIGVSSGDSVNLSGHITYYQNPFGSGGYCQYQQTACAGGTAAVCTGGDAPGTPDFPVFSCPPFARFLYIREVRGNVGICHAAAAQPTGGPGTCY
jgi:hypothetical protein